jgi:hypothetical protein
VARELLRELGPLLADDGIDVNTLLADDDGPPGPGNRAGLPDMETLQHAMNRAIERRNMQLFSPVRPTREDALTAMRAIVAAILDDDTALAATLLEQIQPESTDNSTATVASSIGIALGLLDDWLPGHDATGPAGLGEQTRLPRGHFNGGRAATDILVLARKGRAFRSLDTLLVRQGGPQVLAGSALALTAATGARARLTGTSVPDVIAEAIN